MLSLLDLRGFTGDLRAALPRPSVASDVPLAAVREILADVKQRGDDALRELTQRFDGVELDTIRVPTADLQRARDSIPASLREALDRAAEGIADFHASERATEASYERDGILVRTRPVPVDRAGCYVPGGRAVYPSTVLMTAIPARVAGVPQVVLCVPPDRATGAVPQATLAAAAIAEVDEVYAVGGAQAIAAMAYGTDSIAPVDVIVGPGNIYVAIAKRELAGEGLVGIPSAFAGPSEVVVVADETTPVDSAAIDVIVQAEHGPHGLAWLITWSEAVAEAVNAAIDRLVARAPRRDDIEATLAEGGYAVLVDGPEEAIAVANAIAPEHLELMCSDPDALVSLVRHAGAVFCGPWAPASVGDYIAGPSHVLPTFGSARFGQALTVADFTKLVHIVTLDEAALGKIAPHVAALAEAEGLPAHAASVRIRMTEEPR